MAASAIRPERVRALNRGRILDRDFVVYWMQAAQRADANHALEYAAEKANELRKPLVAVFGLTDRYPEANERHYAFMLEGLKETQAALRDRGIPMAVLRGDPDEAVAGIARRASLVVVDDGCVRVERAWRRRAAAALPCALVEVETNAVVPVRAASAKEEYAAATLRPKVHRLLDEFLKPLARTTLHKESDRPPLESWDIGDTEKALSRLDLDRSVPRAEGFRGGASEAARRLRRFVRDGLEAYAEARNDPTLDGQSGLSPYLHFGQISPLAVALAVKKGPRYGQAAFLEELIVRRELGRNFVLFNAAYDRFEGLPGWCRSTLIEHEKDPREFVYTRAEFERGATHDPYWNAAQKEMMRTGKMHGYMRMYWGKKILEWSASPREALRTALVLNNRYELDGRDANGFAGVAWCFGKHDRPWARRPIYGTIRTMTSGGLRRKFDADAYVRKVERMANAPG